jgi:soluble lytic murein transglycosylase-like protein
MRSHLRGRAAAPALLLSCALLVGTGSRPALAGTVVFVDGRGLTVQAAWLQDGLIYMRLPGGGTVATDAARVARVLFGPAPDPVATEMSRPMLAAHITAPPPHALEELIRTASRRYDVDERLVRAVVAAESGSDARAVSPVGAMGLMQLMPSTASELRVADAFDPEQNLDGGVRYLRGLLDRFPGRPDLALAAYNAGPAAVERHGGMPPFSETRAYVRRVLDLAGR